MSRIARSPRIGHGLLSLVLAVAAGSAVGLQQWWHHVERRREDVAALRLDRELGVTVEPLDLDLADDLALPPGTRGIVVTSLAERRPADRAGIRAGDVIEQIGALPVSDPETAASALDRSRGTILPVVVNRRGRDLRVTLNRG
jgi:C-terminal processing protease CtpA/Prc